MLQQPINFDNFTFRSHYMGELMTPAKEKSNKQKYEEALNTYQTKLDQYMGEKNKETVKAQGYMLAAEKAKKLSEDLKPLINIPNLSETCKSRLIKIYTEVTTGRKKKIASKYLEKGLHTEEDVITMYSLKKGMMFRKNKVRKNNGFIEGEMDFEESEDISVDAKSNWDIYTFDQTAVKKIDRNYEWQGHCYMWLFDKKIHRIAYGLINTPDFLIKGQLKRLEYEIPIPEDATDELKKSLSEIKKEATEDIMKLNIYDDLPLERKMRIFEVKRDDNKIDLIKENVPNWRYFLNNINTIDNGSDSDGDTEV